MNRRQFLIGAGSSLATLGLGSWTTRARADGPTPRRFVFFVEGNGTRPRNFMTPGAFETITDQVTRSVGDSTGFPTSYGHDSVLTVRDDLSTAPSLAPLGADLAGRSAVVLGLSSTVTGGGHTTNFGALSCTRSTPGRPGGPTIDAVLAALPEVRGETPFDAVRVGVHASSSAMNTSTCAFGEGQAAPMIIDPVQAFNNLFGSVGDDASRAAFAQKARLLDYALADAEANLAAFPGSRVERAKLETLVRTLGSLKERQALLVERADVLAEIAPLPPASSSLYRSADPLERLQAHVDLVQAALIGGLTNVAVVGIGTGGSFDVAYPSLVADVRRHDLHHMGVITRADALPIITAATRELVGKAAGLARDLEAVPEGDGTMLDNTLIVVMSDNGETHHSSAHEWPMLLIGGQAMGFATDGRTTVFPGVRNANNRQVSNLFNTLAYAAGTELDDFGSEGAGRIAPGPLAELWG